MFPLQGSGVFYAGYVLFQIPSNLILSRLGARTWLPFITAAWGAVATCCIFIKGKPQHKYLARWIVLCAMLISHSQHVECDLPQQLSIFAAYAPCMQLRL
jgi:hypothetical protein